ncbi:response regulator [Geothrix limicola]|uniref:Response regulator n=1 Tax=Geothrix limicola TaxID=2927978 RepID=A0ABQ5QGQ6_9BACT|nr:response regulator [Geothrix limicola]GLH73787.1 response regulator [Geothrix limicola]
MPRILLVEDNELNRDSLSRLLMRQGMEVIFAVNGEEGVRVALAEQPDLVLMDIGLPVLDGFDATRTLRERGAAMPIIALTAHALQSDQDKALAAGCNDFETKPVEFQQLMRKIRKLLGLGS